MLSLRTLRHLPSLRSSDSSAVSQSLVIASVNCEQLSCQGALSSRLGCESWWIGGIEFTWVQHPWENLRMVKQCHEFTTHDWEWFILIYSYKNGDDWGVVYYFTNILPTHGDSGMTCHWLTSLAGDARRYTTTAKKHLTLGSIGSIGSTKATCTIWGLVGTWSDRFPLLSMCHVWCNGNFMWKPQVVFCC